jgi:hypothetical protein
LGKKESASVLATMLYDWYKQAEVHTAPHYIARAVFGYLLVGNLREASHSLDMFIQQLLANNPAVVVQDVQTANIDLQIFPSLPLLNFLRLLCLAVPTGGSDVFRNIKSHYSTQLKDILDWNDVWIPFCFLNIVG